jgi:hypothetical protein
VADLLTRVEAECGRLDVLVNDIFGGDRYAECDKALWEHDVAGSRPDAWGYIAAYGMEEQSGKDVERFR